MTEKITGGYTMWARKTVDSEIFYDKPAEWFKIWFYLVSQVNHKDHRKWKRGECHIEYKTIAKYTKTTHGQVQSCIKYLKKEQMLTTRKSTRGMNIKVNKYNVYQANSTYENASESIGKSIHDPYTIHTINKNDKNDKNIYKQKKFFGEFQNVALAEDERTKLKTSLGQKKAKDLVDRLDAYIESTGKKYKSHYATILNWSRKDAKQTSAQTVDLVRRYEKRREYESEREESNSRSNELIMKARELIGK